MAERIYEIDGENFSTLEEFTRETINRGLVNASIRRNLDASKCGERDAPRPDKRVVLVWKNSGLSRVRFGREGTLNWLEERAGNGEQIDLESAKEKLAGDEAHTLFDTFVESLGILLRSDEQRGIEIRFE